MLVNDANRADGGGGAVERQRNAPPPKTKTELTNESLHA
jgi:hypothetical protein